VDAPKLQTRLKVVLLSLPARTQAVLEFFFTSTGRSSFAPCTEDVADAAVFDFDTIESRQHWDVFYARTGRPGIALSMVQQYAPGTVWVQKPVTPASLLAAAGEIHAGRWQPAESAPVVMPPQFPPAPPPPAVFDVPPEPVVIEPETVQPPPPSPPAFIAPEVSPVIEVTPAPAFVPAPVPVVVETPVVPVQTLPAVSAYAPAPVVVEQPVAPHRSHQESVRPSSSQTSQGSDKSRGSWTEMGGFIKRFFRGGSREAETARPDPRAAVPTVAAPVAPAFPVAPVPAAQARVASPAPVMAPPAAPATVSVPVAPAANIVPVATSLPSTVDPVVVADTAKGSSLKGIQPAHTLTPQDEARLCGPETTPTQLSDDPSLRYDPAGHLVTALREAYLVSRKWQVPTRLDTPAGVITVDSVQNRMYLEFSEPRLMQLCAAPMDKRPKTRTLGLQEAAAIRAALEQESKSNDLFTCRIDATLWRAGMETARGRLPLGVNPGKTVYLKHWPNLTRLLVTPHALRVAALWSTRGATPLETASQLGVPLRHVVAVYNAALALDLITEDGSHIRRAQRKAHRNRGLLTRLFTWLHQ
jgi:hypothetical protein